MSLVLNYGYSPSLKPCSVHTMLGSCVLAKTLPKSLDELAVMDRVSICYTWGTCGGFSAKKGRNLRHSAGIVKASRCNDIAFGNGSPRLRMCRGSFIFRPSGFLSKLGGIGYSDQAKVLRDRQKEKKRKHVRKKLGQNAKDVHVNTGYWRLFGLKVPLEKDVGKDQFSITEGVLEAIAFVLKCNVAQLPDSSFRVARKSLDARKDPRFVYTIDIDVENFVENEAEAKSILSNLHAEPGKAEFSPIQRSSLDLVVRLQNMNGGMSQTAGGSQLEVHSLSSGELPQRKNVSKSQELFSSFSGSLGWTSKGHKARVVVVGSGPAGLFAALSLAETGSEVVLLERGQPVEARGRDIGALVVRHLLDPNSNLCYGEELGVMES